MTYRGVYRDGIVLLEGDVHLRNGDRVDVNPARSDRGGSKKSSRAKPRKKAQRSAHPLIALAGIWKDRPDWRGKTSVEIVAELRRRGAGPLRARKSRNG